LMAMKSRKGSLSILEGLPSPPRSPSPAPQPAPQGQDPDVGQRSARSSRVGAAPPDEAICGLQSGSLSSRVRSRAPHRDTRGSMALERALNEVDRRGSHRRTSDRRRDRDRVGGLRESRRRFWRAWPAPSAGVEPTRSRSIWRRCGSDSVRQHSTSRPSRPRCSAPRRSTSSRTQGLRRGPWHARSAACRNHEAE
jgi:hypothetical protein